MADGDGDLVTMVLSLIRSGSGGSDEGSSGWR
jgi:hypothetical protein